MKTFLKFAALAAVALGVAAFAGPSTAQAQVVVTGYAPAVSYYRPRPILRPFTYAPAVTAVPTTAYYAPAATAAYYAPTTSYYAPAATTSYYAPSTPTTTYYAPSVAAPTTTYYAPSAPVTTYYAPSVAAPVTTYYAPSVVAPPVVQGW